MKSDSKREMYNEHRSANDYLLRFDWESLEDAKRSILWHGDWDVDTRLTVDFLQHLNILTDGIICDFGTGVGRIAAEILNRSPGTRVVGIDRSLQMLRHAERYLPRDLMPRYERLDLTSFLSSIDRYGETFRCMLMIEVLQHIPEVEIHTILPLIQQTLQPGGVLFVLGNEMLDVPSEQFGSGGRRVRDALARYSIVENEGIFVDLANPRWWFECHRPADGARVSSAKGPST